MAVSTAEGCAPRSPCDRGRARDVVSGRCLAVREVRALAAAHGRLVAETEVLACPGGGELTALADDPSGGGPRIVCLAGATQPPSRPCPAGAVAAAGDCVRVTNGVEVDVARWLHAVIGPDGGEGTPLLCAALARAAGTGVADTSSARTRLHVTLSFPDNDVSLVAADARSDTAELEGVVDPMLAPLRALGATATQGTVTTTVHCGGPRGDAAAVTSSGAVAVPQTPATENDEEN
jgi:hypothetical protein